jgi:hypothetical protein
LENGFFPTENQPYIQKKCQKIENIDQQISENATMAGFAWIDPKHTYTRVQSFLPNCASKKKSINDFQIKRPNGIIRPI